MGACCASCAKGRACESGSCGVGRASVGRRPGNPLQRLSHVGVRTTTTRAEVIDTPQAAEVHHEDQQATVDESVALVRATAGLADLKTETEARSYRPTDAELRELGVTRQTWDRWSAAQRMLEISRRRPASGSGPKANNDARGGGDTRTNTTRSEASSAMLQAFGLSDSEWATLGAAEQRRLVEQFAERNARDENERREMIAGFVNRGLDALGNYIESGTRERLARLHEDGENLRTQLREASATRRAEIEREIERMRAETAIEIARANATHGDTAGNDDDGQPPKTPTPAAPSSPEWVKPALIVGGGVLAVGLGVLLMKALAPPPPPPVLPYLPPSPMLPPGYALPGVR